MNRFIILLFVALAATAVTARHHNKIRASSESESRESSEKLHRMWGNNDDLNGDGIWVDWDITKSTVPLNAVPGGMEGDNESFVIRAKLQNGDKFGYYPGKYLPTRQYAAFTMHTEIPVTEFQVS